MRERTLDAASMAATITSRAIDIRRGKGWAVQFVWLGTPTGTCKVQSSVDGSTWEDVSGASIATGGAPGNQSFNTAAAVNYPYIRLVYTFTSGTGTLTATTASQEIAI